MVDQILKDPEHLVLTGERREVTVLFCDVRGFTPMAERLSPEEVVALLNNFYNLMIDTIFRYQGTVDKFLGDGVMAVFLRAVAESFRRARQRRDLAALSDHSLRDIGLSRVDVESETAKPMWRA